MYAKLNALERYVKLLEGLKGRDFGEPYTRGALERYLQLAAESALDAGEMVIAFRGLPKAETYRDVILNLGEAGVLPRGFAEEFAGVASLRNILVHDYERVDVSRLAAFLGRLDDFRAFARHLDAWLRAA